MALDNPIDLAVSEMWKICLNTDTGVEPDGVEINAYHDQWWGAFAECVHGHYKGVSNGIGDPSSAFLRLRDAFVEGHAAL